MTTPNLQLDELTAGMGQPHLILNHSLKKIDWILSRVVDSFLAFDQPNFDVGIFGRTHIITGAPVGEWAGKPFWVASWLNTGVWTYVEPKLGMMMWSRDYGAPLVYVGISSSFDPWRLLIAS